MGKPLSRALKTNDFVIWQGKFPGQVAGRNKRLGIYVLMPNIENASGGRWLDESELELRQSSPVSPALENSRPAVVSPPAAGQPSSAKTKWEFSIFYAGGRVLYCGPRGTVLSWWIVPGMRQEDFDYET